MSPITRGIRFCMLGIILLVFTLPAHVVYGVESSNLDNVIAYPNPFQANQGHTTITFDYLTSAVRLRIYKITGELIFSKNIDTTNGTVIWNVRNSQNQMLAPGLYIYLLTNGSGHKKVGKIIILQ